MVAALLVSTFLGRTLGARGLGIINLTTQVTTILVTLLLLGTPQLLIRELAVARNQQNWKRIGDLMKSAFLLNGITALAVSILFVVSAPFLSKYVFKDPEVTIPLMIALAVIVFQVLSRIMASGLIAYRKIWQSNLVNESLSVIVVGILLIVSWLFKQEITVIRVAVFYAVGRVFVTIFISRIWRKLYTHKETFTNIMQPILKNSLPFLLGTVTGVLSTNIDTAMIGALCNIREVGIYAVAARLAMLNIFFLQVTTSSLSPKLAALYSENKIAEMNVMVQRITAGLLMVALFPLLLFLVLGNYILSFWGNEFVDGYWILIILSIGQVFNIGTGHTGLILNMCGYEKLHAKISLISTVVKISLNLIFIRLYGAMGAAIGTALVIAGDNLVKMMYARKRVGIITFPLLFRNKRKI